MNYYERLAKGDRERNYEWLSDRVDKVVEEKRQRRNMESLVAGREFVKSKKVAAGVQQTDAGSANGGGKAGGKGKDP